MRFELDLQVAMSSQDPLAKVQVPELPSEPQCLAWLQAAQQQLNVYDASPFTHDAYALTLRFVMAEESQQLNFDYRGIAKPTNVLSFPADDWADLALPAELLAELGTPHLGDLVFCVPVVDDEAQAMKISLEAHWAHLIIHGYLHLQGFDHIDEGDALVMEGLESKIMQQLGYADPYSLEP